MLGCDKGLRHFIVTDVFHPAKLLFLIVNHYTAFVGNNTNLTQVST